MKNNIKGDSFKVADKFLCKYEIYQGDGNGRVVVLLPAIGVEIRKYETLIEQLVKEGFQVVTSEIPGYGNSQPKPSRENDYNYSDLLRDYLPAMLDKAIELNAKEIPIIFGHSLGGHIATLFACSTDRSFSLFCVATGNVGYKNWQGMGQIQIITAAVVFNILTALYGYLPGKKIGFGIREAKGLMRDWSRTVCTGNYYHVSAYKGKKNNNLSKAVYICFKGDNWAPLKSSQELARLIPHSEVSEITMDIKGNPHSAWIKQPGEIIKIMKRKMLENKND
ncbi:Alpha/beta hydrolase family protein [Photorhabdus australis subsp. thailandensis]|uniref:Alpha/beta hydrolase family protein n=1 Tax=Photorhabdus australis subsp. thailandensis TaxID=2805096 RepID=A0A1C0U0N4_9GAMM|nr:alpha/beta fold hydrolase [Photorhabdus australis]OCQ51464.1 Alpha/beta hydrolase family protein [Photorhabdus australis subsp. thailandensis]